MLQILDVWDIFEMGFVELPKNVHLTKEKREKRHQVLEVWYYFSVKVELHVHEKIMYANTAILMDSFGGKIFFPQNFGGKEIVQTNKTCRYEKSWWKYCYWCWKVWSFQNQLRLRLW